METLQEIKHGFYAYRNGELADTLRRAGMPYKVIFGLQVPQIAEIARRCRPDMQMALSLWGDREVRESRLLATYLFPHEAIDLKTALKLTYELRTREEADMLAFRLLRHLQFAKQIAETVEGDRTHPFPYSAVALRRHLE